jgi:hypothetical protein
MLSPNARNRSAVRRGGASTCTLKLQEAVRRRASVAVHVTLVAPSGNVDPLAGAQAVVTGASPFAVTGAGKDTATA